LLVALALGCTAAPAQSISSGACKRDGVPGGCPALFAGLAFVVLGEHHRERLARLLSHAVFACAFCCAICRLSAQVSGTWKHVGGTKQAGFALDGAASEVGGSCTLRPGSVLALAALRSVRSQCVQLVARGWWSLPQQSSLKRHRAWVCDCGGLSRAALSGVWCQGAQVCVALVGLSLRFRAAWFVELTTFAVQ